MKEEYINLLADQIKKLENEKFDLEAWKSSTTSILSKVYDKYDPKVKQIERLKIDYSSWMLRDSSSTYKPIDSAKMLGREILESTINEIRIFGLPDQSKSIRQNILDSLSDELKGSDFKKLQQMVEDKSITEKHVREIVNKLNKNSLSNLVTKILVELS
ncbi:MAG TPA: hypothetical protein ACFCUD_04675 [Cyclobacteriaceae bacterium]